MALKDRGAGGGGASAASRPRLPRALRTFALALFVWRRRPADPVEFAAGTALAPALVAVALLGLAEIGVLDLLVARWSPAVAWTLSAAAIVGAVYLIGLAKSLRHAPTRLAPDRLALRLGHLQALDIDYRSIRSVEHFPAGAPRREERLDLAPLSSPNVVIALNSERTVGGRWGKRRSFREIGVRIEEAERFVAALRESLDSAPAPDSRLRA